MVDPLTAMYVIGTGLSIYGGLQQAGAESDAALANADFFEMQKDYTLEIGRRKQRIFREEADVQLGEMKSTLARAGVSLSGKSVMQQIVNESMKAEREERAIGRQAEMEASILGSKAGQARERAANIRSNAPLQAFGSILSMGGQIARSKS